MCKRVYNFLRTLSSEPIIPNLCCCYVTKPCCCFNGFFFFFISVLLSVLNSLSFSPKHSSLPSSPLKKPKRHTPHTHMCTHTHMHTQTQRNTGGKIPFNSSRTLWWLIYLFSRFLLELRNKTRQGVCYAEITHTFGEVWNTRQRGAPSMTQDESYLVVTHT